MHGVLHFLTLALLQGCGADRPPPIQSGEAAAVGLTALPFAELEFVARNRLEDPADLQPIEDWQVVRGTRGLQIWQAPLPVRPRTLFHSSPPPGMRVETSSGQVVPHLSTLDEPTLSWNYDQGFLRVADRADAPPIPERGLGLRYPLATERERRLNHALSGIADREDFVRIEVQEGSVSFTGLLLPAPGVMAWDLTIPAAAELHFTPGLVRPEIGGIASDGVTLQWEIEHQGSATTVWRAHCGEPPRASVRVDLSEWAGQQVRLRLRSEPGASNRGDYAFVGEPAVASRKVDPHRVVLVFIDTLRPDHLGVYGYERDTSPALDAWAEQAVVFENARSVAPWTLPTTRAVITGEHPELYDQTPTLAERLSARGWATAVFAGNVYLSSNFDMHRGWGHHQVEHKPGARTEVARARQWLEANPDRDALVMLHFMDVHLPYEEPRAYASRWAGARPDRLSTSRFTRSQVLLAGLDPAGQQYVRDRYDGAIRFVDDTLAPLLDDLDDAIVVIFSDHGEEFWDHGDFEHGHTLYDELLRVPLIVRAPGLAPGRVQAPVSLLDLTPTVLDLVGVEAPTRGDSLVAAMRGDPTALATLDRRDIAFGRPLYGDNRWGTLRGTTKYTTSAGDEALFDLSVDPGELTDVLKGDTAAYRERMADALDTQVVQALRFLPATVRAAPPRALDLTVTVPGGVRLAWVGDDPTGKSSATAEVIEGVAHLSWQRGYRQGREVYVLPEQPLQDATVGTRLELRYGSERQTRELAAPARAGRSTLVLLGSTSRDVQVTTAVVPLPYEEASALEGFDAELSSMLQELGYAVGTDAPDQDTDEQAP